GRRSREQKKGIRDGLTGASTLSPCPAKIRPGPPLHRVADGVPLTKPYVLLTVDPRENTAAAAATHFRRATPGCGQGGRRSREQK
ncbi:unnamed protein product, partial [Pylaiella littoralis]